MLLCIWRCCFCLCQLKYEEEEHRANGCFQPSEFVLPSSGITIFFLWGTTRRQFCIFGARRPIFFLLERTNERANERTNYRTNYRTNELPYERITVRTNYRTYELPYVWITVRMNYRTYRWARWGWPTGLADRAPRNEAARPIGEPCTVIRPVR